MGKHHVLIVEDDGDIQELLKFHFEKEGFNVSVQDDGREALSYLDDGGGPPDIIILDLLMPDVGGIELLRRLQERPELDGTPRIVLTGLDDEDVLSEAFESGATDFVTKPFSPRSLLTRVNHLL